jgi:hypothetical protein
MVLLVRITMHGNIQKGCVTYKTMNNSDEEVKEETEPTS